MKTNNLLRTVMAAGMALLMVSCAKDDDLSQDNPLSLTGEEVMVNFSYSVQSLIPGDIADNNEATTRTVPTDIVDGVNIPIKNMFIIQFDGASLDSKMIGAPRFLNATDLLINPLSVPLVEKNSDCYTLFVANIASGKEYNWNLSTQSTFADVVKRVKTITNESGTYKTLDSEKTLLLSAVTKSKVLAGLPLQPEFTRGVAKITLNLTLDNADMEIKSVRLRNISNSIVYADATLTELGTNESDQSPLDVAVIDYDAITATASLPANGETKSFSWYVPRNQRGVDHRSTAVKDKSFYAPAYATYFEIIAVKKSGGSVTSTSVFRVYPGNNQTNDYNLNPNKHYTIALKVIDDGTDSNDSRVEKFENRNLTVSGATSNSFIINSPPSGGATITYDIPITQVNRYWGSSSLGYGNTDANTIKSGDAWSVELLWSDTDGLFSSTYSPTLISLINNNGGNIGTGTGPDQCFRLSIPAGMPTGNFTLGIRKSGSEILWSWHFWVTDYNPDKFNRSVITSDKYTYPVPGGQVERYGAPASGTNLWGTKYANSVMMDRALGADEEYFKSAPTSTKKGILHYQFGRKDPFPLCNTTSSSLKVVLTDNAVLVKDAVITPNVFYYRSNVGGNWCTEVTSTGYVWNDPDANDLSKSIYDPCPPGWRLPANGTWNDFNRRDEEGSFTNVQNSLRDLAWGYGRGIGSVSSNVNGLRYWPGTTSTDAVGGRIWFPATGYRASTSGSPTGVGSYGYYWSGSPSSTAAGYYLNFYSGSVNPSSSGSRAYGFAVRCIAE